MKFLHQGIGLGFPEGKVAAPALSTRAREQLSSFISKAFTATPTLGGREGSTSPHLSCRAYRTNLSSSRALGPRGRSSELAKFWEAV